MAYVRTENGLEKITDTSNPLHPEYVAPLTWDDIRQERDEKLTACDWTQLEDAPLTAQQKQDWADYRQDLRDVPQDFATPDLVVWPETP